MRDGGQPYKPNKTDIYDTQGRKAYEVQLAKGVSHQAFVSSTGNGTTGTLNPRRSRTL